MEQDYLDIKDFAIRADKAFQGIYKSVKNSRSRLHPFVKYFEGSPKIHKSALLKVYGIVEKETTEQVENVENEVENEVENVELKLNENKESPFAIELIGMLESEIDLLRKELDNKEEQLKKKDEQIENLFKLMAENNKLLAQQQHLSVMDKRLMQLESGEQKERKKGFFNRLFNKKGVEIENNP